MCGLNDLANHNCVHTSYITLSYMSHVTAHSYAGFWTGHCPNGPFKQTRSTCQWAVKTEKIGYLAFNQQHAIHMKKQITCAYGDQIEWFERAN